ncbi:hypothetical protein FQB35_11530 [Crassaminicella thermophila]|uniref:Uncharacterized protein n=1 Tax=Crassaminicella thermophila TaxID=2599308 RepID=A0A5C0SE67_CRATE|nr:hypothetical protein [Crassaminicella thermophila]QEK12905.1 hypothetical protein FQB35_11530 [Crassaminicella thermophila]
MKSKDKKYNIKIAITINIVMIVILGIYMSNYYSKINMIFYIILSMYLVLLSYYEVKLKRNKNVLSDDISSRKIILIVGHIQACIVSSISFIQNSNRNYSYKFIMFVIFSVIFTFIIYYINIYMKKMLINKFKN